MSDPSDPPKDESTVKNIINLYEILAETGGCDFGTRSHRLIDLFLVKNYEQTSGNWQPQRGSSRCSIPTQHVTKNFFGSSFLYVFSVIL